MAAESRIVDLSEDAATLRRRRRRAVLRLTAPILGVVLVIVAIIGIALFSHEANRRGVLALSNDLLDTLDAQIAQRVAAFLDPSERTLRIMRGIASTTPSTEQRAMAERFAASVLKELPQIAAFYVGRDNGDFLMVRRKGDGVETKQIIVEGAQRSVYLVDRNAAGQEIARREDPTDAFDPRTRPWYEGALKSADVFWTGIYVFFSDGKPGITVSARVPDDANGTRVVGVDVTLEELSRFLASLEIGAHGRAVIMDEDGRLIAVPNSEAMVATPGEQFVPPKLDELGDPVLTAAFDRFRIEGRGRRVMELDDVRYITSVTPMPGATRHWWIMIVVPEDDFIGFVASNNRTALSMSLIIVIAVVALSVLLVRQGLRSDRSVRLMTERGRMMAEQSAAYAAMAERALEGVDRVAQGLTAGLLTVTRAARASAWRFQAGNQVLHCLDSHDRDSQGHAGGFELHRREMPAFFDLVEGGEGATIPHAASDRRSQQFHRIIMQSLGSGALTVLPLHRGERVVGVILLEDAQVTKGTEEFLRTTSAMFAAALEAEEPSVRATVREKPRPVEDIAAVTPILPADLGPSPAQRTNLHAQYFAEIAVMHLSLSGSLALARKAGEGEEGIAARLAALLQETAGEHGVSYLKMVGQESVAAAGFDEAEEDSMARIAALAIALRDRLSQQLDEAEGDITFRIGLGFGAGYGCLVGLGQGQFNLWGEAFDAADAMALSAAPGAIQASAAAYARLRHDYLFRPRGAFYLPGIGQSRTFVLAGQL
jgi:class 3 adenylate cyclase